MSYTAISYTTMSYTLSSTVMSVAPIQMTHHAHHTQCCVMATMSMHSHNIDINTNINSHNIHHNIIIKLYAIFTPLAILRSRIHTITHSHSIHTVFTTKPKTLLTLTLTLTPMQYITNQNIPFLRRVIVVVAETLPQS